MNSSRDNILENIRKAIRIPSHMPNEQIQGLDERIQTSLKSITPVDYSGLRDQFKKELEKVAGEFHELENPKEMAQLIASFLNKNNYKSLAISGGGICAEIASLVTNKVEDLNVVDASNLDYAERRTQLAKTEAALLDAAYAVADIGSLVIFPDDTPSMLPHFLPDCIFVVIQSDKLLPNVLELISTIPKDKAKKMLLVTGPSRTADIEKIIILGAHGPRCLIVGMLKSN